MHVQWWTITQVDLENFLNFSSMVNLQWQEVSFSVTNDNCLNHKIVAAKITEYLLEKSRVVSQAIVSVAGDMQ